MRKLLNKIFHAPIYFLLIMIVLFFAFPVIDLDAESTRFAIVSTMGIDKIGDEIEVSLLVLAPKANQSNVTEKYVLVSAKDKNLNVAIQKVGLHLGKEIVLGHMVLIVISDNVMEQSLAPMLDYLVRSYNLGNRTVLINCSSKAKSLIELGQKIDESSGFKLSELTYFNEKYSETIDSNLEDFYTGILRPTSSSLISYATLSKEETDGIPESSTGGSEGGQNSQSQDSGSQTESPESGQNSQPQTEQSENQKVISNKGGAALLKEGKKIYQLSPKNINGLNWVNGSFNSGVLTIENVNGNNFKNATISFNYTDDYLRTNVYFENGKPILCHEMILILMPDEIQTEGEYKLIESQTFVLTEEMKKKIENQIKKEFAEVLQILKDKKCDILSVYQTFDQQEHKQFQKFLDTLPDKDDYMEYITFLLDVKLYLKV